ncbi:MAG: CBS domain-containing protein [Gammaproteobacteria bacterium]
MKAKDIMSIVVETIATTATLQQAAEKMRNLNIGILPVQTSTQLVGILTDRDIVTRALALKMDPTTTPVSQIMTQPVVSCYTEDSLEEVVQKMKQNRVRRVVVLERTHIAVGMVSLDDLPIASDRLSAEALAAISVRSPHKARGSVRAVFDELAEPID